MSPTRFRVRNWSEFQHYRDRNPPWIKLHFALLASEDWVLWNDASKLLAIACMLIASRNDGYVPNNPAYLKRVAYLEMAPDFAPLVSCGFLEIPQADAGTMLASASNPEQPQADARPETEERQRRGETEESELAREFAEWYAAYPRHVGKGQARKAYKTARKKAEPAVLLAGAASAKAHYAGCDPKFIPYPATWLNGERWLDEAQEVARKRDWRDEPEYRGVS